MTVLPITKLEGKRREPYPFEVVLKGDPLGNGLTSIVMPYQIRTISKMRLLERIGSVDDVLCQGYIGDCLMAHLGMEWDEEEPEE